MALTPEEEAELRQLEEEEQAATLAKQVNPALPVLPQVLATQPNTNDPGGDDAFKDKWVANAGAGDAVTVYEPPIAVARKDLLEHPEMLQALFPGEEIPPEFIHMMDENSDIYRTYADHKWGEAANAATAAGKTAYRQARMPWLHGEAGGLSPLQTLLQKARGAIDPAVEAANAFVLGVDDTAAFGAGRRAGEALDRAVGSAPSADPNAVGGVSGEARAGADPTAINEMLEEEHPLAHTAGQVVGLLSPLGAAGRLWKGLQTGVEAGAKAVGGGALRQGLTRLAGGTAAAGVGAGVSQAAREGVEAAASLERTGDSGTTLGEAAGRSVGAALDPVNLALGAGGELIGGAGGAIAKGIRESPRYGGAVGRFEGLGGKIKFGRGPVAPKGVQEAIEKGKARDIRPEAVIAEELTPAIAAAEEAATRAGDAQAKQAVKDLKAETHQAHEQYYASPEGQAQLPITQTVGEEVKHLRERYQSKPNGLQLIGTGKIARRMKTEFNADIDAVSLKPAPGAIELSPEEAEAFLHPVNYPKGFKNPPAPPPPAGGAPPPAPAAPGGGTPNAQGVNVLHSQAPTVPPKGGAARPAGYMSKPTIKTPEEYGAARNEYGEAMRPYREAQRADNARAALLDKETAGKLGGAVALGAAGAALSADDEAGAAAATAGGLAALLGKRGLGLKRPLPETLDQVSRQTAAAVQRLTPAEKAAISNWSSSSFHTKEAFRRVNMTPEQHRERLKRLGWSDADIEKRAPRAAARYSEGDQRLVNEVSGALEKLTVSNPTEHGPLLRGFSAGDKNYNMPDIGDVLTKDTFVNQTPISTSYNPEAVSDFAGRAFTEKGQTPVYLVFEKVNKASPRVHPDIQGLSEGARQREAEVIIPPGSTFKVVGRETTPIYKYPEGHKYHDPNDKLEATVVRLEQTADAPREAWKDAAMIAATLGVGAATGDEESGAVGAAAGGLALALKKKGISKVYVQPRRYNARQLEVRKGDLQILEKDPKPQAARIGKMLHAATFRDRDQFTLNGQPGGWSEMQNQFHQRFTSVKQQAERAAMAAERSGEALRLAPGGPVNQALIRYASQRPGELPLKKRIETAGKAAGVEQGLRDLRIIEPYEKLRGEMAPKATTRGLQPSPRGMIGATYDAAMLRGLYPITNAMGNPAASYRGGGLARARQLGENTPTDEDKIRKALENQ